MSEHKEVPHSFFNYWVEFFLLVSYILPKWIVANALLLQIELQTATACGSRVSPASRVI